MTEINDQAICCDCRRCNAVDRFFFRLAEPNSGIDLTDEGDDFSELLLQAAAFGCIKPKKPILMVPRKKAVPMVKVSQEKCALGPENSKTTEEAMEVVPPSESPMLQLESSEMEVDNTKSCIIVEVNNRLMVDAATSYYIPTTPTPNSKKKVDAMVGYDELKKGVDAEIQTSEKSLMAMGAALRMDESDLPSPVPFAPPMTIEKRLSKSKFYQNSPIANYIARKSGCKVPNEEESPLVRKISIPENILVENSTEADSSMPPLESQESPVAIEEESIGSGGSPSVISMVHPKPGPVPRKKSKAARAKQAVTKSGETENPAGMFKSAKYLPCIVLPSVSDRCRRSHRVRVFGNSGIVRHPDHEVVGVLCCSQNELARIQNRAKPLISDSGKASQNDTHTACRELNAELADGSGRIMMAPDQGPSRFFGLFFLSSTGRGLRNVRLGYFKFTIIEIKGDHIVLSLRDAEFTFRIGGQFAVQPGDDYALSIQPHRKSNKAVIAFEYVLLNH